MFVICINTSCNLSKLSRKFKKMALSCDDRKIMHIFLVVVVVVVELRLESGWLLNEITIRERMEEHVMAASFASR